MLNNRIVITGSPCSGKTALINELDQMGFSTCPESAATYINGQLEQGKSIDEIIKNRLAMETRILHIALMNELNLPDEKITFLDRSSVDSIAYSRYFGIDLPFPRKMRDQPFYPTFFVPKHLCLLDGRLEGDTSEALAIEKHVEDVYTELGMQVCHVPLMSIKDRVFFILNQLRSDPSLQAVQSIVDHLPPVSAPRLTYEQVKTHPPFQAFTESQDVQLSNQAKEDAIARIVVSGFVLNEKNEILILRRSATAKHAPGSLETPGGKQEPGETLQQSLRREIAEETGLTDVECISLVGQCDICSSIATWRGFTFCLRANSTKVLLNLREHSGAEWRKLTDKDFFDKISLNSPCEFIFMRHLQANLQKQLSQPDAQG